MTRTTIRLDEHLLAEAKEWAIRTRRTLTEVIEDAVREALARRQSAPSAAKIDLPVYGGGGVQPGIDLSSTAALLDVLDDERDPS